MEPSEFKMEDFMDVVYKCKICPYSCTQSLDMGLHVKEKHLKQPAYNSHEKTTGVPPLPPRSFLYNARNSTQLTIQEGNILSTTDKNINNIQESDDVLDFTQAERQAYMDKSLPRAIPVTQKSSPLTVGNEATSNLTELISIVKDKDGPCSIVENHQSHSLTFDPVGSQPGQQTPVIVPTFSSSSSVLPLSNMNNARSQSMAVMAIQLPAISSESNPSQYMVQTGDNPSLPLVMNEATETKEFLLCGLCKLAFTTMEDCQSHMQTEHRELMQGLGVSIGVQVGGGKRGRKRKSEVQQTDGQVKVKDEPPDLDPDDVEWLPSVPEGNQTTHRDGRMRRKVIPPKALKEDYVLGRRVVKKRQRCSNSVLGYTVVCPMMNCKARFRNKQSMEIHLSSHNLDDASFTCPECQASHDFWKHLRIHLWKVHKIDVDLLTCDKCDYKTDTSHKMSIHKEIHTDAKPYKCSVCNKGFRQASQQKNHMTIHRSANEKPESCLWFASKKCDICDRIFANSKCLAKHKEAVHAKLKPFQCSFCGHTTARKAMMELHIRTHTGEKPFKCNVCSYTTGDHNSMRRHKMRHTGEKQYRCSLCPYTCIQSISLKQHIKNKHPGVSTGIFQCSRCPFRSINQTHFDSHILDHKKGLIPDIPVTLKVNEVKPKKLPQKQATGNAKQKGVVLHNGVESIFRKHPQFHTIIPGDSQTGQSTLEAITVGPSAGDLQTEIFNMQVSMLAGGDTQVSAEDMTRLSENNNLLALGISPLQLIYATLSTISEQMDLSCMEEGRSSLLTTELVGGIQTSVLSSVQENAIIHSITYHFPVMNTTATSSTTVANVVAAPPVISIVGDKHGGIIVDPEGGDGNGGVGKIQSVINVDDVEILDNSKGHLSSSLLSSSSLVLSNNNIKEPAMIHNKVGLMENAGEGSFMGSLVSSSFLNTSGFIGLVGNSLKTGQQDMTLEVVGQDEERSVFLIEDDNDLVEKSSDNTAKQIVEDNNGGSLFLLGEKPMELEETSNNMIVTHLKLPEDNKNITPVVSATVCVNDNNTVVTNLNSIINKVATDQQNHLTVINTTAAASTSDNSNIMQLIPISFLDQNNGQEFTSSTVTSHQAFMPSSK